VAPKTSKRVDRARLRVDEKVGPDSGSTSPTPYGSGMDSGTTNFADHLRGRCEEVGLEALAEALDRLEAPWEGNVNEHAPRPVEARSHVDAELRSRMEAA
jgi:hypothetical protein